MYISTAHKKLVLNLKDPDRVLSVIPTAKPFELRGRQLVAVPHLPDEVRVLQNLGFEVPSPVRYQYRWSGQYTPADPVQLTTVDLLTLHRRAYVLNDMGTGKTISALWAFDYLRQMGLVKRAVVVAPLSTLEATWMDTVFTQFFHLTGAVVHGTRQKRLRILSDPADIYILNHDGLRAGGVLDALVDRHDIDLVIIDELATFRNSGTESWRALNKLCNPKDRPPPRVWGMTGTPTPNAPTDAWAQCKLVTPHTIDRSFRRFRDLTMRQIATYKWVPKDDAADVVRQAMQPAVRFTLDECVDLPPLTKQTRVVSLTHEQEAVYKAMANKMKAEAAGAQISAVNEADKLSKLVQIACGAAYTTDGGVLLMPGGQRVEELNSTIEQSAGKVIVFVPYIEALRQVADQLQHWGVGVVYGDVSKAQRDDIFRQFARPDSPGARVLVAHPKTMSHGLTLIAATTIVWFAPTTSNDIYQQANARIRRPGQPRPTAVIHLSGTAVERKLYARLEQRQSFQGVLLDSI